MNKTNHHIYKAEQIDWEKLESVGISRSQIEKDGNLDLLLQGEETNVMSIKIKTPVFSLTMDATLSLIEDENGNPVISISVSYFGCTDDSSDFFSYTWFVC